MRLLRRISRASAMVVVSAAMVFSIPSAANAAPNGIPSARSAKEITHSVFKSASPHAAFKALDSTERALFLDAFRNQTSVTSVDKGGRYQPTQAERAKMHKTAAPAQVREQAGVTIAAAGCWYRYWEKKWYDLGIHDGTTWMQLNWCGSGGRITSWSQSNVGCAGYHGASCSVSSKSERNVGWEVRSSRYYNANFFGFSNTICMQIRGGATGQYSSRSSNSGTCSLS